MEPPLKKIWALPTIAGVIVVVCFAYAQCAETDLLATYNFTRHLQGYTGYSYFFPGGFIHKSGPHKASNFYYAALQYTF